MNEQVATPSFQSYGGTAPENYERYFVPAIGLPLAAALVESAGLSPGERVLDVACGTGVVARLAAERVGTAGHVTGLDVNPGMLAVAHSASTPVAIEWREARAEDTQVPDEGQHLARARSGPHHVRAPADLRGCPLGDFKIAGPVHRQADPARAVAFGHGARGGRHRLPPRIAPPRPQREAEVVPFPPLRPFSQHAR